MPWFPALVVLASLAMIFGTKATVSPSYQWTPLKGFDCASTMQSALHIGEGISDGGRQSFDKWTVARCKEKCAKNKDCKGFNYNNDMNLCRYKKSLSRANTISKPTHDCWIYGPDGSPITIATDTTATRTVTTTGALFFPYGWLVEKGSDCACKEISCNLAIGDNVSPQGHRQTFDVASIAQCKRKCAQHKDCDGFNYQFEQHVCRYHKDIMTDRLLADENHNCYFYMRNPTTTPKPGTSAFAPTSKQEMKAAANTCLDISPVGNCSAGPLGSIESWDVSNITNMSGVFMGRSSFNQDLSKWNVSHVTDMRGMFKGCSSFNQDLSPWQVSHVTDMSELFRDAIAFDQTLCGLWATSKAIKIDMFRNSSGSICTTTTTIPGSTPNNYTGVIVAIVLTCVVVVTVQVVVVMVLRSHLKKIVLRFRAHLKMPGDEIAQNEIPLIARLPPTTPNRDPKIRAPTDETKTNPRITETVPLPERTFANSNYKRFYSGAEAAPLKHNLLGAVENMLMLYAKRINPALDQHVLETDMLAFMKKIQGDAFKNDKATENDVDAMAEYLWTSGKKHAVIQHKEFCSVLNAVIRDDVAEEIQAAAAIFRSINNRRVQRVDDGPNIDIQSYPPKGETWRGGGFRREHRAFFERMQGQQYRVPGFLATTDNRQIAAAFAFKADKAHPCAIWRITFDSRGKRHPKYRVQHMTFVSKTLIEGEHEYLFAPYSVFKLVSIKWSEELSDAHEFTIRAARDNKQEDEDMPLTPWY